MAESKEEKKEEKKVAKKSEFREYASSILIAVGLALVIRTGVVQAFYIPSGSMEDTLLVGDYLLANKFIYGAPIDIPGTGITLFRLPGLQDPQPGDIVIFRSPVDPDRDLIKRCVAVAGDTVMVKGGVLFVNGEIYESNFPYLEERAFPLDGLAKVLTLRGKSAEAERFRQRAREVRAD